MNCPKCGSSDIRKRSVVFQEGTTCGHTETPGGKLKHFSQTPLAAACAPPERPAGGALRAGLTGAGIGFFAWAAYKAVLALKLSFHWALWSMAGGFFILLGAVRVFWYGLLGKKKEAKYHELYAAWERSWICLKCGEIFTEEPGQGR